MNYNIIYVKQLWEKNYWRKSRSVRVFSKNCASNFFRRVGEGVTIMDRFRYRIKSFLFANQIRNVNFNYLSVTTF